MKMCIRCNERPAEVPDRRTYIGGRFIKKVCTVCHNNLLRGDLIKIIDLENERAAEKEESPKTKHNNSRHVI